MWLLRRGPDLVCANQYRSALTLKYLYSHSPYWLLEFFECQLREFGRSSIQYLEGLPAPGVRLVDVRVRREERVGKRLGVRGKRKHCGYIGCSFLFQNSRAAAV